MVEWTDVIIATLLAYYWIGFDIVLFHSQLPPYAQPGYVRKPVWYRFFAGALWPMIAYRNREFAFFIICFFSSVIVLGAAYIGLNYVLGSTGLAVLVLGIMRTIPITAPLIAVISSIISMFLWTIIAKPLGCKLPEGME